MLYPKEQNLYCINSPEKKRDGVIDVLRCIGTLLVILAHVNPPAMLAKIRSFDVCILVMISGYCFRYNGAYLEYLNKRIKRLCFPAWITATVIISLGFLLCIFIRREYIYSLRQIVETYLFIGGMEGGIGLFWIVRIYLLMALIGPLLSHINKTVKSDYMIILLCISAIVVNQLIYVLFWNGDGGISDLIIENFVMSTLGYSVVFLIGNRINQTKRFLHKVGLAGMIGAGLCILYLAINKKSYNVSYFKYPPQLIYIVFSIAGSVIIWILVDYLRDNPMFQKKGRLWYFVTWFSKKSYDIYFAHAIVLCLRSWGDRFLSKIGLFHNWLFTYLYVVVLSCLIVAAKDRIIHAVHNKRIARQ